MEEENDLLNFSWEEDDFFPTEEPKKEEEAPAVNKEQKEDKTKDKKEKPEDKKEDLEQEEEFFFNEEDQEEEKKPTEDKKEVKEEDTYWQDIYNDFKENKLLRNVEIEEGEEITSERLLELQEEDYEIEVKNRLKSWADTDMDDDGKAFIQHKLNGGTTKDFFSAVDNSSIPEGNIEDEKYQDKVIRYQLKEEGWDDDEIEDRLEYLTESGKKEKIASKYDSKIKEQYKSNKESILAAQQEKIENQKRQAKEYQDNIKSTLDDIKEVNGFSISPKRHSAILNSLTKRSVKTASGGYITPLQQKLSEVFKDPEKTILLTELIETDFDFTPFKKKVKSSTTRNIRKKIGQQNNTRPTSGSSGSSSLADLFNN